MEGARTLSNSLFIAPSRSRSVSSIESASAHIAVTRVIALASGFAPALLAAPSIRTRSATRPGRPNRSASRTSDTSPASATRLDSSNATETAEEP